MLFSLCTLACSSLLNPSGYLVLLGVKKLDGVNESEGVKGLVGRSITFDGENESVVGTSFIDRVKPNEGVNTDECENVNDWVKGSVFENTSDGVNDFDWLNSLLSVNLLEGEKGLLSEKGWDFVNICDWVNDIDVVNENDLVNPEDFVKLLDSVNADERVKTVVGGALGIHSNGFGNS